MATHSIGTQMRHERQHAETIDALDKRDHATQKCGGTAVGSIPSTACCSTGPNAEMANVVKAATGGGAPAPTPSPSSVS